MVKGSGLRTSLENLDKAYDGFFKLGKGFPKFKRKGRHDSYKTINNRSTYKGEEYASIKVDIKNHTIKLPKLGNVKMKGYRNLQDFPFKILNATITKEAGKYYVSVCVEEKIEDKPFTLRNIVGIDLGIKDTISCSDGLKYQLTKKIKGEEQRIKGLQKSLARSEKGSNNREKLKLKIQRAYQKIRNMRKYFIHEVTCKLVRENDIITTETLKVKEMIEQGSKSLSKGITNASFGEILRVLTYKAKWQGKKLYKIGTYYPSSQICNHCEYKEPKVKDLSVRTWECAYCGSINDRDINASLNILEEGMKRYFIEMNS